MCKGKNLIMCEATVIDEETWMPLFNQDVYEVSNHGRVRSWASKGRSKTRPLVPHMVKSYISSDGYPTVTVGAVSSEPSGKRRGHGQPTRVHKLVLEAFVGPRPVVPGIRHECRHLDGNKTNNNLRNLCWGTAAENGADRARLHETARGENNYGAKLTLSQVLEIRHRYDQGKGKGVTHTSLANQYNVGVSTIGNIIRGTRWRHFSGPRNSVGMGHGFGGGKKDNENIFSPEESSETGSDAVPGPINQQS